MRVTRHACWRLCWRSCCFCLWSRRFGFWFRAASTRRPPKGASAISTFAYYGKLLADRQFFGSLVNSLTFSFGATVIALCVGGLVAWLVERTNAPLKAFAYLTAIISLGTPFVLYVIAWLFLLGRAGPLNDLLASFGWPRFNVYSMPGMILVEGFLWSPLAFLLLSSVFQQSNADYEEAARMCGRERRADPAPDLATTGIAGVRRRRPSDGLCVRSRLSKCRRWSACSGTRQGADHRHLSRHDRERSAR